MVALSIDGGFFQRHHHLATSRRKESAFVELESWALAQGLRNQNFDKNEIRKKGPLDKWYMDGRFGALPLIDKSLFPGKKGKKDA